MTHSLPVIDAARLREIAQAARVPEGTLLAEFATANEDDACQLRDAVRAADFARAALLAHRVGGAGRMIGALRLARSCERIRLACDAQDAAALRCALALFELGKEELDLVLSKGPATGENSPQD